MKSSKILVENSVLPQEKGEKIGWVGKHEDPKIFCFDPCGREREKK